MFNASGTKVVNYGSRMTFTIASLNCKFTVWIFPARLDGEEYAVLVVTPETPLPEGVRFGGGFEGEAQSWGGYTRKGYLKGRGGNPLRLVIPGEDFDLFTVQLIDPGSISSSSANGGLVLNFKNSRTIPPELDGEGIIETDPHRFEEIG